jgi:CheY-like chemotaxis protein
MRARCLLRAAHGKMDARPLTGTLALIVDDDPDCRELFELVLTRAGAVVATAANAAEAREWLAKWNASVVICDVAMPGEDGLAFLRRLRAEAGPNRDCKAIATSSAHERLMRPLALAGGFNTFVPKAAAPDVLVAVVRLVERSGNYGDAVVY